MRKLIAALAASALLLAATPAVAGGYGYGYGGHGHNDYGYYVLGGLVGGLLLGNLIAQASTPRPYYQQYYQPAPQPSLHGCRPTTGTGYVNGRLAQFGGTMCYDAYGNGYILNGSRYFIGYLR